MEPSTSTAAPRAMPPTSWPRFNFRRGSFRREAWPKSVVLSSVTMLRKAHLSLLGNATHDRAKRCLLFSRLPSNFKGCGETVDGLVCLAAWRGGHKSSHRETGAGGEAAQ